MTCFGNFPSKFDGALRLLNFTHTFFQSFADFVIVEPYPAQCCFSRLLQNQCLILLYGKFEPSQLLFGE